MGDRKFSVSEAIEGGFRAQWRNGFMLKMLLRLKKKTKRIKKREEESMGPIQPRIGRLTQTTN